ncbi:uncharacterized protein LY79DRAFT_569968 [Colletotrichum navitas]|uniref:Uncharacterized protein n=1 Tax=Colletotrichum navitas TaxID=681940 RepID=A0AAD8PM79_9PEZI|nr:uncharacterized protein LY79DRAFT_569968 [Colletotrichum navitas]KAK1572672.1 hypothetical protein LY79DRAFT_569968 [Colletotrichum navitas]
MDLDYIRDPDPLCPMFLRVRYLHCTTLHFTGTLVVPACLSIRSEKVWVVPTTSNKTQQPDTSDTGAKYGYCIRTLPVGVAVSDLGIQVASLPYRASRRGRRTYTWLPSVLCSTWPLEGQLLKGSSSSDPRASCVPPRTDTVQILCLCTAGISVSRCRWRGSHAWPR